MTKLSRWKRASAVLGLGVAVYAVLVAPPEQGRSAEPPNPPQNPIQPKYLGSKSCKTCHDKTPDTTDFNYAKGFIKFDEYPTWADKDKHTKAFQNLLDDRAKRMGEILGQVVTEKEAGCLGCHSASSEEKKDLGVGRLFNAQEGVSCENCHGPSSIWNGPHWQEDFFTNYPKFEDRKKIGMYDMREPAHQAQNCQSCHIGDVEQGKVVTHKMYAAGHPPLPSIEVATFSNMMPRHWFLPTEKPSPTAKAQRGVKEGDLDETKLAIVGAAQALRTSMKLVAEEAKSEPDEKSGKEWPDYARFDCWSCHHDLKRESWRQARGYEGPPGRISLNGWPVVLVELGIEQFERSTPNVKPSLLSALETKREALRGELFRRPFGKAEQVSKLAGDFDALTNDLVQKLSSVTYNKEVGASLLHSLLDKAQKTDYDFDTARQMGWGLEVLLRELGLNDPKNLPLQAVLKKIHEGLDLSLPSGREYEIESHLGTELKAINNYEPEAFKADIKALSEILSKK